MAPLEQAERNAIASDILQELANSKFACSSLNELNGGTTNFTFRGVLKEPIASSDGTTATTIIVKRSTDFAAINTEFQMPISRSFYEEFILHALNDFPGSTNTTTVKAPRLYQFRQETNTQVLEDFPESIDLKSILVSPTNNERVTHSIAVSIAHELGLWLRSFHTWADETAQDKLRNIIGQNEPMRQVKYRITYNSFLKVLEDFPELLEGTRQTLEQVKAIATKEFETPAAEVKGKYWGLVHGDFWTGNVLVPNATSLETELPGGAKLFIVDWELSQLGHRAFDLGQMICDLYEKKHFRNFKSGISAIEAFVNGYGGLDEELAFSTAIYTGVHLICWYTRRPPRGPLPSTPENIAAAMKLGRDFILKGVEKDKNWFLASPMASLFQK